MLQTITNFLGLNSPPTTVVTKAQVEAKKPLTPRARRIRDYLMARSRGLTAVEAMVHFQGMTSATLSRRITELHRHGWPIINERNVDPMTGITYTRYRLDFSKEWPSVV